MLFLVFIPQNAPAYYRFASMNPNDTSWDTLEIRRILGHEGTVVVCPD